MRPYRCPHCNRRLFDADANFRGLLIIVCRRCRREVRYCDGRIVRKESTPQPTVGEIVAIVDERFRLMKRKKAEMSTGLRFQVFERDAFRCRYCGKGPTDGVDIEIDHVQPVSKGGQDEIANLVTACWKCNNGKSNRLLTALLQ